MNPRPLGYEHPNRRLNPLPQSPPSPLFSEHIARRRLIHPKAFKPSRGVLVTGLVTGFIALPETLAPGMVVNQTGLDRPVRGSTKVVRDITALISDPVQMPSATLMHAVASWLDNAEPIANGAAAPQTVARPTIQAKNARGRGVVSTRPCATAVATRLSRNAVSA